METQNLESNVVPPAKPEMAQSKMGESKIEQIEAATSDISPERLAAAKKYLAELKRQFMPIKTYSFGIDKRRNEMMGIRGFKRFEDKAGNINPKPVVCTLCGNTTPLTKQFDTVGQKFYLCANCINNAKKKAASARQAS